MAERVTLLVYDLSQGMARSMSLNVTGRQIDGIWHTSVVVFGREWYYGQGVMNSVPGGTMHGTPLERIDMGETEIPQDIFIEFVDNMRETYTADRYHLLDNNCNNFSNDMCNFLVGKSIPSHITSLPADFLQTPFGQMMRPMIENMFGPTQQAPLQNPTFPLMPTNATAAATTAVPFLTDLTKLRSTIANNKAVAVYFTSATCPPCRVIAPIYDELIQEKQDKIVGVKVDIGMAQAIGRAFSIRSTPTFMFFLNGEEFSQFSGANQAELRSSIDLLIFSAAHPHKRIKLEQYKALSDIPILFPSLESLDAIFTKLDNSITAADSVTKSVTEADRQQLQKIRLWLQKRQAAKLAKNEAAEPALTELGPLWKPLINKLLGILPFEQQFPLLDIVRMLILHPRIAEVFAKDGNLTLVGIFDSVATKGTEASKGTNLLALRIACNAFSSPLLGAYVLSPAARQATKQLLVHTLLSQNVQQRQAAASLAFDIGNKVAQSRRLQSEERGAAAAATLSAAGRIGLDEDWNVECLSAIAEAIESEESEEVLHRLVASIANFIYTAEEETGATLLNVLGLCESLQKKMDSQVIKSKNVVGLCQELQEMVRAIVAPGSSS
ncbi:hypothetical protein DFQ26_007312 [Actinomortierella ambigua]|nr:hypothetical protein DFQ26_007312 [Actinomortierella ambigua]